MLEVELRLFEQTQQNVWVHHKQIHSFEVGIQLALWAPHRFECFMFFHANSCLFFFWPALFGLLVRTLAVSKAIL